VGQSSHNGSPDLGPRLVRALDHPVRGSFLGLLASRTTLSAPEAAGAIEGDLGLPNLVYHVRVLAQLGLVEPAGKPDFERGLPFKLTPSGRQALTALGISSN
jgi:DNA-binding MarR family transcriptional regulator